MPPLMLICIVTSFRTILVLLILRAALSYRGHSVADPIDSDIDITYVTLVWYDVEGIEPILML